MAMPAIDVDTDEDEDDDAMQEWEEARGDVLEYIITAASSLDARVGAKTALEFVTKEAQMLCTGAAQILASRSGNGAVDTKRTAGNDLTEIGQPIVNKDNITETTDTTTVTNITNIGTETKEDSQEGRLLQFIQTEKFLELALLGALRKQLMDERKPAH